MPDPLDQRGEPSCGAAGALAGPDVSIVSEDPTREVRTPLQSGPCGERASTRGPGSGHVGWLRWVIGAGLVLVVACLVLLTCVLPVLPADGSGRILLTILAVLMGLGAGLSASIALARGARFRFAGVEPDLSAVPSEAELAPFLCQLPRLGDAPPSSGAEAIIDPTLVRAVRMAVLQRIRAGRGSTILVTSAEAGSGKTAVSILLGDSLTAGGKRVLLVDVNARHPALGERLGLGPGPGLIEVLRGASTDDQAIRPVGAARLSVLPAGDRSRAGRAAAVEPEALSAYLERWQKAYDVVLLDGGAVLPVGEVLALSRMADGTILVAREGHSRRTDVVEAVNHLVASGARFMGTVFVSSSRRGPGRPRPYRHAPGGPEPSRSSRIVPS